MRPVEQICAKERVVLWLLQRKVDIDLGHQIDPSLRVEQVGDRSEQPTKGIPGGGLIGQHRGDLRSPYLAVCGPFNVGDLASAVAADLGRRNVIEIDADGGINLARQPALDNDDIDRCAQADREVEQHLGLVQAAGSRHRLAVEELGQREVADVKTVEHVQIVARADRPLDAVGIEAERQIDGRRGRTESGHTNPQWTQRILGQSDIEVGRKVQQWHFVGEQRGATATEDLRPITEIEDVRAPLEARPRNAR